ncbi:Ankyrin repeat-containing protein [Spironucleus salmonicida]|uniref:Ankyrin repeat-containing protein n=1 Tax=Spironucleus salmonicida TaxID=348837 RepID=V6LWC5_9EUKA|nr:Ankyrin repeat-containing protein [Spironucleus salmonicida]|eukprot:EST48011.1 Ankyrin repeat-containing protein [Spironucleus salmonicida]
MGCGLIEHTSDQFRINDETVRDTQHQPAISYQERANNDITHKILLPAPEPQSTSVSVPEELFEAIKMNEIEIVQRLGAKFARRFVGGKTPLMAARTDCQAALLLGGLGLQTRQGRTALMIHASCGCLGICQLCLPEARMVDDDGRTALMHASKHGHAEVVHLLASYEGEIRDDKGRGFRDVWAGDSAQIGECGKQIP